jgi:hypothetical protein
MMQIRKDGTMELPEVTVSAEDMALINGYAKAELKPEDVFVFAVRLCDTKVDRDFEMFTPEALWELKEMFLGKTGIFDHDWTARGQVARIFRTEIKTEPDGVQWLKAWAYMMRTAGNEELIREIQGGIKREVSVGCSVKNARCSICGGDIRDCGHVKGRYYDGKLCCGELSGVTDAYEWSFVAVPAQREAGVVKKFQIEAENLTVQELVKKYGGEKARAELNELMAEAELGGRYMKGLRQEVVRLSVVADSGFDKSLISSAVGKMDEKELLGFKKTFEDKIESFFPVEAQLGRAREFTPGGDDEFRI